MVRPGRMPPGAELDRLRLAAVAAAPSIEVLRAVNLFMPERFGSGVELRSTRETPVLVDAFLGHDLEQAGRLLTTSLQPFEQRPSRSVDKALRIRVFLERGQDL